MAVPPRPGRDAYPTLERDPHDQPSPRVPRPLPDQGRSRLTVVVFVALVVIAVALVVLL